MAEEGCSPSGTSWNTSKECPECGKQLRATGNPQKMQYRLTCPDCGYQSHQLSLEEVRDIID